MQTVMAGSMAGLGGARKENIEGLGRALSSVGTKMASKKIKQIRIMIDCRLCL